MTKYLSAELLADSFPEYDLSDISNVSEDQQMREIMKATNRRAPYLLEARELTKHGSIRINSKATSIVLGASASDHGLDEPSRIFFALGVPDEPMAVNGAIEGRQAYGYPFVGYIETAAQFQRRGLATKILPILNTVCAVVYSNSLSAGPDYYLSSDGRNLQDALVRRYDLTTNQAGFVHG